MVLNRVDVGDGALIYADLDKFKQLERPMGHPAGDAALMHFARIIRDQIRTGDIAARVGGEEFAIWLPGARLETGYRIAERIRIRLQHHALGLAGQGWRAQRVASAWPAARTLAARSATYPPRRMRRCIVAKNSGRNRVERAGTVDGRAGPHRTPPDPLRQRTLHATSPCTISGGIRRDRRPPWNGGDLAGCYLSRLTPGGDWLRRV